MFLHFRNIIRKCRRKSERVKKNMKSAEHAEIILNSVQYTKCLQHKNAACGCLNQGLNLLHDNEHTLKDKTDTEKDNGYYFDIDEFESPNDYELIKPDLTDAENEYFSVGTMETNIQESGCKQPAPQIADDLSVTKVPVYLRLSQNDDIMKPVSADIGDYLNPKTCTTDHLHQGSVDIDYYLHPVDTDIDDNVHFQPQKDA